MKKKTLLLIIIASMAVGMASTSCSAYRSCKNNPALR